MSVYSQMGIYRITNTIDDMSYIGKTSVNFGDRWDCHRALLRSGKHSNSPLQEAWNKYGEGSFEFAIVEVVDSADKLNDLEIKYISDYRSVGKSYNLHDGGDSCYMLGRHLSDEAKRKIGEKNRINMTGRKLSEGTRKKMSESQRARYALWTDEDRISHGKISAERASGYHWSVESRRALSDLQRNRPNSAKFTPDEIKKIREERENGAKMKDLAEKYHTSSSYISSIVHKRRWANI